jgi:hypothetical protein
MSTLTETILEYRWSGLEVVLASKSLKGSSTAAEDSGCADLDRNKLRRCARLPVLLFRTTSSPLAETSASETVLNCLFRETGRLNVELRLEGADDMASKFEVEVFVRGFVNLVGGLRGASADCVFPIVLTSAG